MGLPMEYFDDDDASTPEADDQRKSRTGANQDDLDGTTELQLDAAALQEELDNRSLRELEDYAQMIPVPLTSRSAMLVEGDQFPRAAGIVAASNDQLEFVRHSVNPPINDTVTAERPNQLLPPAPPEPDELWSETVARVGRWFLLERRHRGVQPSTASSEADPTLYLTSVTTHTEPPSRRATRPNETRHDRSRFTYTDINPPNLPTASSNRPITAPYPATMSVPSPHASRRRRQPSAHELASSLPTISDLIARSAARRAARDFNDDEEEASGAASADLVREHVNNFELDTDRLNRLMRRFGGSDDAESPGAREDDMDEEVIR